MKKLLLVLLAFLAVFTYVRAYYNAEAGENVIDKDQLQKAEIILPDK